MRYLIQLSGLILITGFVSCSALPEADTGILEQEVTWFTCEFTGDTLRLSELLSTSIICITPTKSLTKSELLLQVVQNYDFRQQHEIRIDSFRILNARQVTLGVYAFVGFEEKTYGRRGEKIINTKSFFLDVWARHATGWRAVFTQKHY